MLSGQEHVQQNSQGVDVSGSGYRSPGDLFRRGIQQCHRGAAIPRQHRCGVGLVFVLQKLRNTEVQQLYLSIRADKHIRGLEVSVHNQICMRMGNGSKHVEREPEP